MKPGMEDILDNQKKAFETWKDWSDQWMKNFPGMTPPSSGADFFVPWMDVQRKWMDETMKMGNQKSSLENAPKQWKEWMEVQTQMSDKWMEFYRKQAQQMGDVPGAFNPGKTFFPEMGMKPWQNWMEESN